MEIVTLEARNAENVFSYAIYTLNIIGYAFIICAHNFTSVVRFDNLVLSQY